MENVAEPELQTRWLVFWLNPRHKSMMLLVDFNFESLWFACLSDALWLAKRCQALVEAAVKLPEGWQASHQSCWALSNTRVSALGLVLKVIFSELWHLSFSQVPNPPPIVSLSLSKGVFLAFFLFYSESTDQVESGDWRTRKSLQVVFKPGPPS